VYGPPALSRYNQRLTCTAGDTVSNGQISIGMHRATRRSWGGG
jgi:hypothetical protein